MFAYKTCTIQQETRAFNMTVCVIMRNWIILLIHIYLKVLVRRENVHSVVGGNSVGSVPFVSVVPNDVSYF